MEKELILLLLVIKISVAVSQTSCTPSHDHSNGYYTCDANGNKICDPGFIGDNCQNRDPCGSPSPCHNGGTCEAHVTSSPPFTCHCPPDYSGRRCENAIPNADECLSDPCQNEGSCVDGVNNYTCTCPHGYIGPNCEKGDMDVLCKPTDPCKPGGMCLSRGDSHVFCFCLPGYTRNGTQLQCLEIDECLSYPCQNGGSCVDLVNNYTCTCAPGYTGQNCDTEVDGCEHQPCHNGGTCTRQLHGGFKCDCPPSWHGYVCQNRFIDFGITPTSTPTTTSTTQMKIVTTTQENWCAQYPCQHGGEDCETFNPTTTTQAATAVHSPCDIKQCDQDSLCVANNTAGTAVCMCSVGREGDTCTIPSHNMSVVQAHNTSSHFAVVPSLRPGTQITCIVGSVCHVPVYIMSNGTYRPVLEVFDTLTATNLTASVTSPVKENVTGIPGLLTSMLTVIPNVAGPQPVCVAIADIHGMTTEKLCYIMNAIEPTTPEHGTTEMPPVNSLFTDHTLPEGSVINCVTSQPCHVLVQTTKMPNGTCQVVWPLDGAYWMWTRPDSSGDTCTTDILLHPNAPVTKVVDTHVCLFAGASGEQRCFTVHTVNEAYYDPCDPDPCHGTNGVCVINAAALNTHTCLCNKNMRGINSNCSLDPCLSNPNPCEPGWCYSRTVPRNTTMIFFCYCPPGYHRGQLSHSCIPPPITTPVPTTTKSTPVPTTTTPVPTTTTSTPVPTTITTTPVPTTITTTTPVPTTITTTPSTTTTTTATPWLTTVPYWMSLTTTTSRDFHWSYTPQDNERLVVCAGHEITIPWRYTLGEGEQVEDVTWFRVPEGGVSEDIALFGRGHFLAMPAYSGRVHWTGEGGIVVSGATVGDSGRYTVVVTVVSPSKNTFSKYQRTVLVQVAEPPQTYDGQLHVSQSGQAVKNNVTGEWSIQLTCGHFYDRGHPPVNVEWTFPDGHYLHTSNYSEGEFTLLLPSPPTGGNYSCRLLSHEPAASCLPYYSPLLEVATVEVNEVKAGFSILSAEQGEVRRQLQELQEENRLLRQDVQSCGCLQNSTDTP